MNPYTKVVGPMSSSTPAICNQCWGHCKAGRLSSLSQKNMMTGMDPLVGEIGLLHATQLDECVASNGVYQSPCQGEYLPVEFDCRKANSHGRLVPILKDNPRMNASDKFSHSGDVPECTRHVDNAAQELVTSDLRNLIKGLQANEPLHLSPSHRKSSIESLLRVLTLMERHHCPT